MKKETLTIFKKGVSFMTAFLFIGGLLFSSACKKKEQEPEPDPITNKEVVEVEGNTGTVTWTKDKVYLLKGFVRVQDGQVLTIEKGTLVFGDTETKGTLIIQRGGKIMAEGTKDEPIVFTSEKAPGQKTPGDWGGVVICGKAPNNEGDNAELEGNYGAMHGGNDPNDNSGVLTYARIEYAGIPINPNEEVNSLTMGSVGSGTKIEHIMCSYGLDDAFEWFGGTVNCKYLIAYRGLDDDLDVDLGYSGKVQYALCIRAAKAADQSGSNGFEVDNNGPGTKIAPFTSGLFSNVTIIGPKKERTTSIAAEFQHGAQLRRSNKLKIYNTIITGYPHGLYIDGSGTVDHALANELQLRNVVLAGVANWGLNGYGSAVNDNLDITDAEGGAGYPYINDGDRNDGTGHPGSEPKGHAFRKNVESFDIKAWYLTSAWNNKLVKAWQETGIDGSLFDLGTPKVTLNAGSMLAGAARWDNTDVQGDAFFDKVDFIGAFGTEDWTAGWANWDAAITTY